MDAAIDQRLALEERFLLDQHVAECAPCARRWDELCAVEEGFTRLPEPAVEHIDVDGALDRIRARIEEGDSDGAGRPTWRVAAGLLALGAGLAAGAWRLADGPAVVVAQGDQPGVAEDQVLPTDPQGVVASNRSSELEENEPQLAPLGAADSDALSLSRLMATEEVLRGLLVGAFIEIEPEHASRGSVEQAALAFEASTAELGRNWPLRRTVEALIRDADSAVAGAALRYVGVRGDRISAVNVQRALAEEDRAAVAVQALGDLGREGLDGLELALANTELMPDVLERLVEIGGTAGAELLERELSKGRGDDSVSRRRFGQCLEALAEIGEPGILSLLRLADRPGAAGPGYIYALGQIAGAESSLVALLETDPNRWPSESLFDAVALLQPEGALPRLGELCDSAAFRRPALACLAAWDLALPLVEVRRMWTGGRVERSHLIGVARSVIAADPDGAGAIVRRLEERVEAVELLDLLLATELPACGVALAELAMSDLLPTDERSWAALAIGELEDQDGMQRLMELLEEAGNLDRRLHAAALITIHAIAGPAEASRVIERTEDDPDRVLRALAVSDGGALGIHRVARELGGRSSSRNSRSRRTL